MLFPECVSEIEIHERLEALDSILKSEQQKYIYDLLSFSRTLRYFRDGNCRLSLFNRCICIQTLSYLAHYRALDGDSALSFQVFFFSKFLSNNDRLIAFNQKLIFDLFILFQSFHNSLRSVYPR